MYVATSNIPIYTLIKWGLASPPSHTQTHTQEIYIAIPTVWVGATLGLLFAFLLGRFAFSNWAQKKVNQYPVFMAMQSAISSKVSIDRDGLDVIKDGKGVDLMRVLIIVRDLSWCSCCVFLQSFLSRC